ncbi:MAG: histidine kinase [Tissierellaceae bacterium]
MKDRSFFRRIFMSFIIVSIFPLLFMTIVVYLNNSKLIEQKIQKNLDNELIMMGRVIDDTLYNLNNIVNYIAENKDIQSLLKKETYENYDEKFIDKQKMYVLVNSIEVKSKDIPIYIMSMNNPYCRYSNQQNYESIYGAKNGYGFQKIVSASENQRDRGYYIHRRVDGKEGKDIVLTIVRKIRDSFSNEIVGYIFLDVYDEFFDNIFVNSSMNESNNIYVVDREGIIITDKNNKIETGFNFYDKIDSSYFKAEDGNFKKEIGGEKRYITFKELKGSGFKIIQEIPSKVINRDRILIVQTFILVLIMLLIISVPTSYMISKRLSNPINELSKKMEEVRKGNRNTRFDIRTGDEIEILGESFNNMVEDIDRLIHEVYLKQYLLKEAEIKELKSQIDPHFLYNTLESVKWLIKLNENKKAAMMITALGKLMRESIENKKDIVSIREDLDFIDNYITIQKIRFEDKIQVTKVIDEKLLDVKIPKYMIQPLVENAIIHGIEPLDERGILKINISNKKEKLCIQVMDNGKGIVSQESGNSIALKNIRKRLELYYNGDFEMELYRDKDITISQIIIPMKIKGSQDDKCYHSR